MKFALAALMIGSFLSAPSFAQFDEEEQEIGQEVQQADPAFEAWCTNGTRALQRAQSNAERQVAYGQFGQAARTLLSALQNGVARPNWTVKPVTWRLMVHGQRLGAAMVQAAGTNERAVKAAVNALEGVYDLVLRSADEIDRPYYRTNCGYCRGRGVADFDRRILRMSGDLLALANGHLTYARGGTVYPVGPVNGYLVGAQVLAAGAAGEISNLIFAESLACEIIELDDVVADLRSFNGAPSTQAQKAQKFYDVYERIDAVTSELQSGRGCGYGH